jgi:hypothetical protein
MLTVRLTSLRQLNIHRISIKRLCFSHHCSCSQKKHMSSAILGATRLFFILRRGIALHKSHSSWLFLPPFLPAASTFSDRQPFFGPAASGAKKGNQKGKCRISKSSGGTAVLAEYHRLINTAVNINELLAGDQ